MRTLIINLLTFGTLFSSVLAITSKNPVISVIFVISTFVNAAGFLILIGIHFVGIAYLIIYVGAIAVIFLFVIMMINIKLSDILETGNQYTKNLPLALAIGILFIYLMFTILPSLQFNFSNSDFLFQILTIFNEFIDLFGSNGHWEPIDLQLESLDLNSLLDAELDIVQLDQISMAGEGLYVNEPLLIWITGIVLLLSMYCVITVSRGSKNNKK